MISITLELFISSALIFSIVAVSTFSCAARETNGSAAIDSASTAQRLNDVREVIRRMVGGAGTIVRVRRADAGTGRWSRERRLSRRRIPVRGDRHRSADAPGRGGR